MEDLFGSFLQSQELQGWYMRNQGMEGTHALGEEEGPRSEQGSTSRYYVAIQMANIKLQNIWEHNLHSAANCNRVFLLKYEYVSLENVPLLAVF